MGPRKKSTKETPAKLTNQEIVQGKYEKATCLKIKEMYFVFDGNKAPRNPITGPAKTEDNAWKLAAHRVLVN